MGGRSAENYRERMLPAQAILVILRTRFYLFPFARGLLGNAKRDLPFSHHFELSKAREERNFTGIKNWKTAIRLLSTIKKVTRSVHWSADFLKIGFNYRYIILYCSQRVFRSITHKETTYLPTAKLPYFFLQIWQDAT